MEPTLCEASESAVLPVRLLTPRKSQMPQGVAASALASPTRSLPSAAEGGSAVAAAAAVSPPHTTSPRKRRRSSPPIAFVGRREEIRTVQPAHAQLETMAAHDNWAEPQQTTMTTSSMEDLCPTFPSAGPPGSPAKTQRRDGGASPSDRIPGPAGDVFVMVLALSGPFL